MSTPVGSSQWMYTPASGFYPYLIDQSLRFNDNDSAYLNRTFASAGNQQIWTWSGWVKRGNLASGSAGRNTIFSGSGTQIFGFMNPTTNATADNFGIYLTDSEDDRFMTNAVFRDTSAWYHFCLAFDSTAAVNDDRLRLWVNGVQETSWSRFDTITQNRTTGINAAAVHAIGVQANASSQFFDGYMAEVNFIDGTALDATSFGETINGIWVPKQYSGSYGTNGFYLSFADSAAIGDDLSGNTNDFTANNLAASDVVPDSPTNNFATFNPLDISGTTLTYSEGNLKAERTTTSFAQAYSNFSFDSGKWYAEFLLDTGNSGVGVIAGITNAGSNRYLGQDSFTYAYYLDGRKVNNASYTSYGDSYTTAADGSGDVVGVYIDADNGNIYFSKNGVVQNSGTAAFTGVTGPFRFAIASESNCFHIANFGQDDSFAGLKTSGSAAASDDNGNGVFYDAIGLSGYLAPCTANLPEPAIGPNSDTTSDQHFNTVLYTGNGSTQSITGVGFQPDWTWLKSRSNALGHNVFDVIRGANKALFPNDTNAEFTDTDRLNSFDSDGFSLGADTNVNTNSATYVSWNWKAGGTAVSNTNGSITSSVSANQDAGFSIVGYTGTGANATIGHGLASAPEMFICRNRTNARDWLVYHKDIGYTYDIFLNLTNAQRSNDVYQQQAPDNSLIYLETQDRINESGSNHIMWCFHSVPGYSSVGKYVGNGNADGPLVALNFSPSFVLTKEASSTSGWNLRDNKRSPENVVNEALQANTSGAELTSGYDVDFLSNGFKLRTSLSDSNASGQTYIYLAFAEVPFKYANAR